MKRRDFCAVGAGALATSFGQVRAEDKIPTGGTPFKVQFAPSPRHVKGMPYLDQMKKAHELGFRAWEDNNLLKQEPKIQEQVGDFIQEHGWTMGVSVASAGRGVSFYRASEEQQKAILEDVKKAVEASKRAGQKWFTFLAGARDEDVALEGQLTGAVDLMKRCCDLFDEADLIFVLEPISHALSKKPVLLETFAEGDQLCKAGGRPSCKLLADYYHQQQVGGDLIRQTNECWDEIAYVQYGDVPGRKQPGTGEINYTNVTKHLVKKGYEGIIGLEHGIQGELSDLVAAYREIDVASN